MADSGEKHYLIGIRPRGGSYPTPATSKTRRDRDQSYPRGRRGDRTRPKKGGR